MDPAAARRFRDAGQREVDHDLRKPLAALEALVSSARRHEHLPNDARATLEQIQAQVGYLAALCGAAPSEAEPPGSRHEAASQPAASSGPPAVEADVSGPRRARHLTLVICDDQRMFGESLGAVLQGRGHVVLCCTSDPAVAVADVAAHQPDILVMELHFPRANGVDAVRTALAASPATRAIVLSGAASQEGFARARAAGASACLVKHADMGRILGAIYAVADGDQVFDKPGAKPSREVIADQRLLRLLTERERQVLDRLVRGQPTTTIAAELGMAHSTTRSHIQKLLLKLGAHSRLELVSIVTAASGRDAWTTAIGG